MQTIEATYRINTPMFLGGADPQSDAELRLPSFKGALRFWWRALAYGRLGGDLKRIKEEEEKIFGSTNQQAELIMKITDQDVFTKTESSWSPSSWQNYLGYGLNADFEREYIAPDSSFKITISYKKHSIVDDQVLHVINALKLLGLIGGLGGRSRRGWGSVTCENIESDEKWIVPTTQDDFNHELETILKSSKQTSAWNKQPEYTAFWKESTCTIGESAPEFSRVLRRICDIYKETIKQTPKPERDQFGLPRKGNNKRRASPLFLHVHAFDENNFGPVVTYLPSQFTKEHAAIPGDGKGILTFMEKV